MPSADASSRSVTFRVNKRGMNKNALLFTAGAVLCIIIGGSSDSFPIITIGVVGVIGSLLVAMMHNPTDYTVIVTPESIDLNGNKYPRANVGNPVLHPVSGYELDKEIDEIRFPLRNASGAFHDWISTGVVLITSRDAKERLRLKIDSWFQETDPRLAFTPENLGSAPAPAPEESADTPENDTLRPSQPPARRSKRPGQL